MEMFKVGDPVLAMHPNHENCYAPGQVLNVSADLHRIKIRFYDFVEAVVDVDDCQPFHKIKFQNDINGIVSAEKRFIGKYVIARNSIAGLYDIGKIGMFGFFEMSFLVYKTLFATYNCLKYTHTRNFFANIRTKKIFLFET